MRVTIRGLSGKYQYPQDIQYEINSSDTVGSVKTMIQEQRGIPSELQRLYIHFRCLEQGDFVRDFNQDCKDHESFQDLYIESVKPSCTPLNERKPPFHFTGNEDNICAYGCTLYLDLGWRSADVFFNTMYDYGCFRLEYFVFSRTQWGQPMFETPTRKPRWKVWRAKTLGEIKAEIQELEQIATQD